jgi:hypothetical protein
MYCITNSTNKLHAIRHRVMVLSYVQGQLQILPLCFKLFTNYFIFRSRHLLPVLIASFLCYLASEGNPHCCDFFSEKEQKKLPNMSKSRT